jgi:hypothetical protein
MHGCDQGKGTARRQNEGTMSGQENPTNWHCIGSPKLVALPDPASWTNS